MSESVEFTEDQCKDRHDLVKMVSFDNGRSTWGVMVCNKCGHQYDWQYDYCVDSHSLCETRAF